MKSIYRWLLVLASASFFIAPAQAQNPGTITNHAFAIGKGPGVQGLTSLLCGSAQLAVGQTAADPICRTMSGDATLAATGALTLATVNSNVGTFGSATKCTAFTTNAKGLITAASETTCTPALASITGLGTGVATALAVNVGTAGSFVVNGGALGTPSSGTLTNATGLPVSTGISGLGTGIATWLATPSSANLASALTDETGSGAAVFGTAPTIAGGSVTALTTFGIRSSGAAFDVRFASSEVLTANRILTYVMGDAARTIDLTGGNFTINAGSGFAVTSGSTGTWPIWTGGTLSGASSATRANAAAPSSPSAGNVAIWTDSTDLRFHDKNSAGTIGTTVVADTGASNNYISAISAAGVISKSRPSCSTLSDSTTLCTTTPGTGVATFLATPSSANLAAAITDETGSGAAVFGTGPTISAPTISGLANLSGAVKYSTQSAPSQITSNQNDYNPSSVVCATSTTLLINSDAARDITGLAGGVAGCLMVLVNNGSFTITLKEASGSSTAANRFSTGGDIALAASASVTLLYDGTASRWRMASPAGSGGGGGTMTSLTPGAGLQNAGTTSAITTSGTLSVDGHFGFRNRVINPSGQVWQRQNTTAAAITDITYAWDRWYGLTQSNGVTASQVTNAENSTPYMMRLSQANASAQRFGLAQVIESANSIDLRGQAVVLSARVRMSASTTLRYAIIEWTGTADTVTKDFVNDWTSGTFTAGNFFTSTSTTVTATGSTALTANTLTTISLTATLGSSGNNVAVIFWTDSTQAQNVTLDIGKAQFEVGLAATALAMRSLNEEITLCQRYYAKSYNMGTAPGTNTGASPSGVIEFFGGAAANGAVGQSIPFPSRMRAAPTLTIYDNAGTSNKLTTYVAGWSNGGTISATNVTDVYFYVQANLANIIGMNFDYAAASEL